MILSIFLCWKLAASLPVQLDTSINLIEEKISESDLKAIWGDMKEIVQKSKGLSEDYIRPFTSMVYSTSPANNGWAKWAKSPAELASFGQHIQSFSETTKDNSFLQDDSKIANLLSAVSAINDRLNAGGTIKALKDLLVVIFGHESKGKSSLLDEYLGQTGMSFTAVDQGTLCPVSYYVYKAKPVSIPVNKFKPGDSIFYWDTDIESPDSSLALTAAEFSVKMKDHMTQLKLKAKGHNTATDEVLHCAIYNPNARFQGIVMDLPGWRDVINQQEQDAHNKLKVRQISFDALVKAVSVSHEASIFLCVEAVSDEASHKSLSIKDVTDFFSNNHPQLLKPLLERTVIVLNKFNKFFEYNQATNTLDWLSSTNIAAFESYLEELLAHTNIFKTRYQPTLIGFDYKSNHRQFSDDKNAYDKALINGARNNLRPEIYSQFSFGLTTTINDIVLESRRREIQKLVDQTKEIISYHQQLLSNSVGSAPVVDEKVVFNGVEQGFNRYVTAESFYTNGFNEYTKGTMVHLQFPYKNQAHEDIAVYFVNALYQPGKNGMNAIKKLKDSKISIGGYQLELDNKDKVTEYLTNYLADIEKRLFDNFVTKNGKDEVTKLLAIILSIFESIRLETFDKERANIARANNQGPVQGNSFLKGMQRVVIEDFLAISKCAIAFLRTTLEWFIDKYVDMVLLTERIEELTNDDTLTVLDRDVSFLVFRNRLKHGYRLWVNEFVDKLSSLSLHSHAHDPLTIFAMSEAQLAKITDFSYFDEIMPSIANGPTGSNTQTAFIAETLADSQQLIGLQYGIANQPKNLRSDDKLITIIFKDSFPPDFRFSKTYVDAHGLLNQDTSYAKLFFNTLTVASWGPILLEMKVTLSYFGSLKESADPTESSLLRKVKAFVFHRVGYPMLLSIENTPANTRTTANKQYWSGKLAVLPAASSDDQDKILADMYHWRDSSQGCSLEQSPEKLIYDILQKHFPQYQLPIPVPEPSRLPVGPLTGAQQPTTNHVSCNSLFHSFLY